MRLVSEKKTDSMILTARINSIKRAERVKSNSGIAVGVLPIEVLKEPEKKYNVIAVKGIPNRINDKFFFRLSGELHLSNADTNDNYDQQWTDDQIKDYGLEDYEKIEVAQS